MDAIAPTVIGPAVRNLVIYFVRIAGRQVISRVTLPEFDTFVGDQRDMNLVRQCGRGICVDMHPDLSAAPKLGQHDPIDLAALESIAWRHEIDDRLNDRPPVLPDRKGS